MPQLYNDNVGEVLRKYSADTSVTVNPGESNVSSTGVQQIVAGSPRITLDPADGQGIVTIDIDPLASPWIHFDVASDANGLQFSNTAFNVYQYGNQLNVFRNGILIDPAKIVLVSANVMQINECLFAGDTVDVLNQGYSYETAYSNANVQAFLPTYTGNLTNCSDIIALYSNAVQQSTAIANVATNVSILQSNVVNINSNISNLYANAVQQSSAIANLQNLTYGNANVAAYLPTYTGNLASLTGNVTTTANVSGSFMLGNGRFLTGVVGGSTGQIMYNNSNVLAGATTLTFDATYQTPSIQSVLEKATVTGTAMNGAINFDILTQSILYYNANATGNGTVNFRGNSTVSLNTLIPVGRSITLALITDLGNTGYVPNAFSIDSSSVTPRWASNVAPLAASNNSTYVYTFSIIKTSATPAYRIIGSQVRFS